MFIFCEYLINQDLFIYSHEQEMTLEMNLLRLYSKQF